MFDKIEKIQGLISAPFTPMDSEGTLNLDKIPEYADFLKRNGNSGVFVGGTTGESLLMSVKERMDLAKAWLDCKNNDFKVFVHVGHNCLGEAKKLASHAAESGADGIGAMAPCFFKPALPELLDFCRELAAMAAEIPFYYYHLPSMTGVDVKMSDFLRSAGDLIPNLAGVKYTHEDMMDYLKCRNLEEGRFDMIFGRDEILLAGLALGSQSGIGSTFNYAMPVYQNLISAFESGNLDEARTWQMKSIDIVDQLHKYGGVKCGKAIMKLVGIDCGPCRKPIEFADQKYMDVLKEELERIDFFDYCSK